MVERVLAGELNVFLTEEIERLGGRAMNLSFKTTNVLFGAAVIRQLIAPVTPGSWAVTNV